ncbi:MAG: hypothetical protein SCK70_16830 [bacterium]|nr:hypothetical protein [bacterium]
MKTNSSAPIIRIGVLQSADSVGFQCNTNFELQDQNGTVLETGQANQHHKLSIRTGIPAKIRYQLRAAIEKDIKLAQQKADQLRAQHQQASLRVVGLDMKINNHRIDNREY